MLPPAGIKHFYIPDEQSIYLLSHKDAKKLKDWFRLCTEQLELLGYNNIQLIGKGAFGFAFAGELPAANSTVIDSREIDSSEMQRQLVFKFSRVNLPQHIQDRLEEEAYMLSQVEHVNVPQLIEFQRVKKQAILVMERAAGEDLEKISLQQGPLSPRLIVKIASQMADVLWYLRNFVQQGHKKPIVHGDIKPSNIVFDPSTEHVGLIDWGSSVFAQVDEHHDFISQNIMDLMSSEMQQTNARLGDVYFIGDDQLNGGLSSPRFDEQGLASTLYALASGQSCRFGWRVITPNSLGLPQELARTLTAMLSDDPKERQRGGDYFLQNMRYMKNLLLIDSHIVPDKVLIPSWIHAKAKEIDTVVYSSRKSFLRAESYSNNSPNSNELRYMNDAQFERYYKNYLQGMGETEKAFISAVSRLGKYPVVGGLAVRWQAEGVYIDSNLNLYDAKLQASFEAAVNNVVNLARAIQRVGVLKCCLFNARDTLHLERDNENQAFIPESTMSIPYELSRISLTEDETRMHSYFEDGDDPDELLTLPPALLSIIRQLNSIHHTGCIIFESLPTHLKIHNYYRLLNHSMELEFKSLLKDIIDLIPQITGLGISGFMKLPYKDTRFFEHQAQLADKFYPKDPRQAV
ncbi:serine/threonine protein kinase [Paraglaciecola hydrolytica]|uniref:Serine/threonine protein kinase n=1 Tax=Paraglaciecola hydrolytica TaxID=1799789 RepID=A0A136A1F5_9ALTE|nr:protein kinase [Paraglaciecola hydrolytica]KXI29033.1 serine/threonine protein kinase [Paraglaciecola hydrolytica]